jgi:branched-chain amino acid transport system permease protein
VNATSLAKAVVDGVLTGGVYALMAAGLTLIFGVMDIINIAQGALIVLGAYMSYVLSVNLGIDLFVGLVITIPAFFVLGVAIEWAFLRRLREQDRTAMSILVTYAVAIIIEGVLSVGIDVNRVAAVTFGVGVAVTAAGGMMFGATNAFNPNSGYDLISRLLSIVILAGLGSIGGALIAALFMVTLEDVVAVVWSPVWATLVYYASLIVVLSFRPNGLFGKAAVRAQ